jgi:hypothetical protein
LLPQYRSLLLGRTIVTIVAVFIRRRGRMTLQVHLIVQDSADFNDSAFGDAIQEEVAPAPTVLGNVERAEAGHAEPGTRGR